MTDREKALEAYDKLDWKLPSWAKEGVEYCPYCQVDIKVGHFAHCLKPVIRAALQPVDIEALKEDASQFACDNGLYDYNLHLFIDHLREKGKL